MSPDNVVRIADYERRPGERDAHPERDPASATIIILPTVKIERYDDDLPCDVA